MTDTALLFKEIEGLPANYMGEILDFVGYLKHKAPPLASCEEAYKAMAADTEREAEALEWCNANFGPIGNTP
jgi:hypothetical protein